MVEQSFSTELCINPSYWNIFNGTIRINYSGFASCIGVQKDGKSLKSSKYHVKNNEDSHYLTGKAY